MMIAFLFAACSEPPCYEEEGACACDCGDVCAVQDGYYSARGDFAECIQQCTWDEEEGGGWDDRSMCDFVREAEADRER